MILYRVFVESSDNRPAQDSLRQIWKLSRRFHRLSKAELKYVSEIGDSKASYEGEQHYKINKLKK